MVELHVGDCRDVMSTLEASSVDAIVTDPPYGIGFMGKGWDHGVPGKDFWVEALRVAKPGAHLLAFGGTRTFHRLAVAIEDAGWEIRDSISWLYGQGMPHSHSVGKAIDAKLTVEGGDPTEPLQTDAARRWAGWGTALKPSHEPIILARKPFSRSVANNVLQYGTGALNVDGCRIPHDDGVDLSMVQRQGAQSAIYMGGAKPGDVIAMYKPGGRWPANVLHDGSDAAVDPLGAFARYFYCAKASRADREDGCDDLPTAKRSSKMMRNGNNTSDTVSPGFERFEPSPMRNTHPTVKPTALMRYLVRLVTPPGGIVLDPFCGSGSTGRGAVLEGASFIGIDLSEEYVEIARRRIAAANRSVQSTPQQEPLL